MKSPWDRTVDGLLGRPSVLGRVMKSSPMKRLILGLEGKETVKCPECGEVIEVDRQA